MRECPDVAAVLLPAKRIASFPDRLPPALSDVLQGLGIDDHEIRAELDHMANPVHAKTASRVIRGSMTDFAGLVYTSVRAHPDSSLLDVSLWLAQAPCSPLGMNSPKWATQALLGRTAGS